MMFLYNRHGALQAFLAQAFDQRIPYGDPCPWGVAQVFNSRDPERAEIARRIVERACDDFNLTILGWRDVPCREDILGDMARETLPNMQQVLIENPDRGRPTARRSHPDRFAIILYRVRRQIDQEAKRAGIGEFHVCSMSPFTVVYKGMFRASQIGEFYQADLGHPDFQVAAVMYHQRYATNTPWFWSNAQPFSMLGHNGEINTLSGNRNWTRARLAGLRGRRARIFADLLTNGSDSYQLNNVLEAVMVAMVPMALLVGVLAGMRGGSRLDRGLSAFSIASTATPEYVSGVVLIAVFASSAVGLQWFKASAASASDHPASTRSTIKRRLFGQLLALACSFIRRPPWD